MSSCRELAALLPLGPDELLQADQAQLLEQHLAGCADCRASRSAYAGLRSATREGATRHAAPAALRESIVAALDTAADAAPPPRRPAPAPRGLWIGLAGGWLATGALACALAVSLLLGPAAWTTRPAAPTVALADAGTAFLDNHARALVTAHLIDVVSSDRHTVKPWFRGRLDFSPPVVDLASVGYPLLGGRLDYVDHRSIAVLVYQRRQHVIDVYEWPTPAGSAAAPALPGRTSSTLGYHGVAGRAAGVDYIAVSDLDTVELGDMAQRLAQGLQAQAAGGTPQ